MKKILALAAAALLLASVSAQAADQGLPKQVIPQCFGVNIHFYSDEDAQAKQIAGAGFSFIRMDLVWHLVEKEKGKIDWSGHDGLMACLERYGIRPLFIVAYGNPIYSGDPNERVAPNNDEYRKAFTNFARSAARRYRNKGVLWEMWNEPNWGTWQPYSPENYMLAVREAAKAIREEDPTATIVGPALALSAHPFLDEIIKLGALEVFDVISVHPYRGAEMPPETVIPDYQNLRALFDAKAPKGKHIPLISGEWGYNTLTLSYEDQARYLTRMFLVNHMCGIPLSIWYDWHDDGQDPKWIEHHFGTVEFDYKPKPAYLAMQQLTKNLSGYRFIRRIKMEKDDSYVLVFSNGKEYKLAAWTPGDAREVTLKVDAPAVVLVDMLGSKKKGEIKNSTLTLKLTKSPTYIYCPYSSAVLDIE